MVQVGDDGKLRGWLRDGTLQFFRDMMSGRLPFVVTEGGGNPPPAKFICGFLGCDTRPFNPLLAHLPRLLVIRRVSRGKRTC